MKSILGHYESEFVAGNDVAERDAEQLFDALIGEADASSIVGLLTAWNEKGWSEDELYYFARIMRSRMKLIASQHDRTVDIVGTGGSRAKTFNVSTAAAFVIAGAGVAVAKHGNRAATSQSGSADVLGALGVNVSLDRDRSEWLLNELGICFMFAPLYHSLSLVLAAARHEIKSPTIFNNLGPLVNPASAPFSLIGVWRRDLVEKTANVLNRLGTTASWVVHAERGLDEVDLADKTTVSRVAASGVESFDISYKDFGILPAGDDVPSGCSAIDSANLIRDILADRRRGEAAEQLVLINAAAALHVAGAAPDLGSAYELAEMSIRDGSAREKLSRLAKASNK